MTASTFTAQVRSRPGFAVIELAGEMNASAEEALASAFTEAERLSTGRVALDLSRVSYINSTGIALIVNLLARARKSGRVLAAVGLNDHYREIFRVTRLADYIPVYADEAGLIEALSHPEDGNASPEG